ncbi:hypothetical protein HDU96_006794 [Phlyctochytrium bullatum]|nr:hypothetical protein HDU96_006794 [Phlyctochytrium bullatum]
MASTSRSNDAERQPFLGNNRSSIDNDRNDDDIDPPLLKRSGIPSEDLKRSLLFFGALFFTVATAFLCDRLLFRGISTKQQPPAVGGITQEVFDEGWAQCERIWEAKEVNPTQIKTGGGPSAERRNPRYYAMVNNSAAAVNSAGTPVLIKNATVLDGIGNRLENVDVALVLGQIHAVGPNLEPHDVAEKANALVRQRSRDGKDDGAKLLSAKVFKKEDVLVVNVEGRFLTPGLVDQHSHVGAYSFPTLMATADGNEMSSQTNPQQRIQDSISIMDPGIDLIAAGGVTTSLVLPGSGTLMGGEALPIKHLRPDSNEVEDMKLNRGMLRWDGRVWRYMKMACGENPKRGFGGGVPTSRMGSGWLYRQRFEQAQTTLRAQDAWCAAARVSRAKFSSQAHSYLTSPFPAPLVDESLVAVLRGDVRLNIHCYETHDIEMMVRNKREFGFEIATFHHAVEAYLVAGLLARENISVALFADHSLYKKEAYAPSVKAGQILHAAGVKVSYKSDHPVTFARHLIYEAQKAHQYGLDADVALAAVTSVPAERMGAGWRIGRVAPGFDADVVVWDRHPLELGARPLKVFIDGFLLMGANGDLKAEAPKPVKPVTPPAVVKKSASAREEEELENNASLVLDAYTVANASKIFADEGVVEKGSVVVEGGQVTCVGECRAKGKVFDLMGGVIIPGLIGANTDLGLVEIPPEALTNDGTSSSADAIAGHVRAVDGLRVGGGSKTLNEAFRGGVLTSISVPVTDGMVRGLSVAFRTGAERFDEAIVKATVGLHADTGVFGGLFGGAKPSSVSGQIALLRKLLATAAPGTPFHDAKTGKLPLVITAHEPNDIAKLLALKRSEHPDLRLILAGGAGAWVVAKELAQLSVPVLLNPHRCAPMFWEARWCRPAGSRPSTADLLAAEGVKVLLTQPEAGIKGNLIWEAGWMHADSEGAVTEEVAVGSVTWGVAKAFGLEESGVVRVGKRANLLGINSVGPLGFGKRIQVIGDGVHAIVRPEQD